MLSLKNQKISIVIPCYNEEVATPTVLSKILQWVEASELHFCEILVVNDGSTDSTSLLIKNQNKIKEISSPVCMGYGAALKRGFEQAQGDLILFLDMDDTYQVFDFSEMLNELHSKQLDVVFGNRLSKQSGMPLIRYLGNQFYRQCLRILSFPKLNDPCTGMRLFKKKWAHEFCQIPANDFSYSIALSLFILKSKIPYGEVEISYHKRAGVSKLSSIVDGWRFLWTILSYR